MSELIGKRYAIVNSIGEGGMASVYLAIDTILKREVAVKVLRGDLSKDDVSLQRFKREAQAATKLSHPNIVEVYDVGEENGKNYIVMEYVKGKTLKELIAARGALSKEEAVNIMRQLVGAVNVAHKNGIIHRDIKSQNVLVKDDGTVKLSDFGIALAQDAVQLTQTDVIVGSVHYLAPELAKGEQATQQSDIYALGIVFYELLTGDVPHHGEAAVQVALKHMREEIPSVRDFDNSIPQSIDNIIKKATVKNKQYRYPTASAMYDDLVTCLDEERKNEAPVVFPKETVSKGPKEVSSGTKKPREKSEKKSNIGLWIFLGALGVILLSLFIWYLGSSNAKKTVAVPDVTGLTKAQAITLIEDSGLFVSDTYTYEMTDDIKAELVTRTNPGSGTIVEEGTTVILYISEGTYYVMDNFVGWNYTEAVDYLNECCKVRIITTYEESDGEAGIITSQSLDEGTKISPNRQAEIRFTVTVKPVINIPGDIIGMNYNDAKEYLESMGANVKLVGVDPDMVGEYYSFSTTVSTDYEEEECHKEENPEYVAPSENSSSSSSESTEQVEQYITVCELVTKTKTDDVYEDVEVQLYDETKFNLVYSVDPDVYSEFELSSSSYITLYYYNDKTKDNETLLNKAESEWAESKQNR